MENNNIAFIESENMILCENDNSTSTDFNMENEETMMENPSQPMDIEEENGNDDTIPVSLRTLMMWIWWGRTTRYPQKRLHP
jgi:hypothetical protein